MLKMKCLESCKQVIQGKDFYRSLFLVDCGDGTTQLIERYLQKKPEINNCNCANCCSGNGCDHFSFSLCCLVFFLEKSNNYVKI